MEEKIKKARAAKGEFVEIGESLMSEQTVAELFEHENQNFGFRHHVYEKWFVQETLRIVGKKVVIDNKNLGKLRCSVYLKCPTRTCARTYSFKTASVIELRSGNQVTWIVSQKDVPCNCEILNDDNSENDDNDGFNAILEQAIDNVLATGSSDEALEGLGAPLVERVEYLVSARQGKPKKIIKPSGKRPKLIYDRMDLSIKKLQGSSKTPWYSKKLKLIKAQHLIKQHQTGKFKMVDKATMTDETIPERKKNETKDATTETINPKMISRSTESMIPTVDRFILRESNKNFIKRVTRSNTFKN